MDDEEYQDFLEYLVNTYVAEKIGRIRRYFNHRHYEEYEWKQRRFTKATNVISYINRYCDEDEDIYATFTLNKLSESVHQVKEGVRWNNRLIKDSGFIYAIEEHFGKIIDGMKSEHLKQEFRILKGLGNADPEEELSRIYYLLKVNKAKLFQSAKEVKISIQLEQAVKILSESQKLFMEEKKEEERGEKPKSRPGLKWFKGLDQISKGAAFAITDMNLAIKPPYVPLLPVPGTRTWRAMLSTAIGIGMILSGVGELSRLQ